MLFENIIGNNENKLLLKNTIKNKNLVHSYLFYGTEGIGKKIFAKDFAKMILCQNSNENGACNKCKSCIQFNSNNNPDFFILEPDGKSIKIDQVRQMQKSILEKPIESTKKIYIINDSHTMTKEAQNCILKTLEEPQDYVIIILIASNDNNILPTVKSRCTKIYFKPLNNTEIIQYINEHYGELNMDNNIIKLCEGSILRADFIVKKIEILNSIKEFVNEIEFSNKLQFIQNNEILCNNQDDIYFLLDYISILLFEKAQKNLSYINTIGIVEKAKNKLLNSNNYDMTIDNLLIRMWEEINEKNNRS